ncbi:capping protein, Arp2/3 and myosin-I linker protein 2 isoform X2 [Mugil cephalus]|uniref:capping protein, Arp2/3 and myosin-I linker protein 2 isoform X2 n=1 Tax=Mugil cephalus TaxID=48193 RepID=UPI001FB7B34F|nr:capping protein, Arp2/3 and myosin-I linker protein 2 isoform X2 [Mugil cephalus]
MLNLTFMTCFHSFEYFLHKVYSMDTVSPILQDQISELLKPHRVCLVLPVILNPSSQQCVRSVNRFVVLSLWRGFLIINKHPIRVESTFSYLEICSINIHSLTEIVLETDRQTLSFSVLRVEDLEAMIGHMIASLKRIFPDSSPGKLLKKIPPDLLKRLFTLTAVIEEKLNSQLRPCGGFSDTYAALCDFNDMPIREEIQWDVDNIYYIHNSRQFNLQDFSHLDSRDLALAVAALSFNQWFMKIYSKELRLSVDVQQQLTFLLSRSSSLRELSLEGSGLKPDFAVKMAAALRENTSSTLQSINLAGNLIEDKGVVALSQELENRNEGLKHLSLSRVSMTARGLGCLCQVLFSNQMFSASLTHLDLSGNPSSLVTEAATYLFKFLSSANSLSHLDLSDTNCPLDTLFVSLSAGCYKLIHLNLARNPFSHRKVREVTKSIQEFFSQSCELKFVGLSATKLPPQAVRLLLQGLATNTRLFGLELDLSSCELRSAGAQVIQEHISEATAIRSLDISDNSFESDMVTLVLSLGRCQSIRHLALGRNFAMKSRALSDVLHRIAQLIQDEECPLQSLSVCDSKLKTGMHILLSALGGHATLAELDISGNNIGDNGAKMLAKALMTNTKLRTLTWDRNSVTARGFQDVADALERNFTLQQVSLPLADITQSYRSNPERTKDALSKIQQYLDRNNKRQCDREELQQVFGTQHSEKLLQSMCQQLEDSLQHLSHCNIQEVQADILSANEVLQNARESFKLLPSLYDMCENCTSDGDFVNSLLTNAATALADEFYRTTQELVQGLNRYAETVCPRIVQLSSVSECLSECVSKRNRQTHVFLRSTLVENTGHIISNKLRELRQTLSVTVAESIIEQVLKDLTTAQSKMDCLIKINSCNNQRIDIPELRLVENDFPTDDYSPAFWRNDLHSKSLRPAPSIKSLLDADWERQIRDREAEREMGEYAGEEDGEGRRVLSQYLTATPLSLRTSGPSPSPSSSPSPSPPGQRGKRQKEGEVVAVDVVEAISGARGASLIPPPTRPLFYSIATQAPKEKTACHRGLHRGEAPFLGCGPSPHPLPSSGSSVSSMEPLPTQGQTLRHYTAYRPRPRRTHTQPPSSRPQDLLSKVEIEAKVDEGVEEFFTKKIIPDYALKNKWEESNPAQATPSESSSTPTASTPLTSSSDIVTSSSSAMVTSSSVASADTSFMSSDVPPLSTSSTALDSSCVTTITLPTRNIKRKFGDLFAFKKARAGRAVKAGGGEVGGGEVVKVKRASIADLIRPLREGKERERERNKEREREKGSRSLEDANISNDVATTTEGITSHHLAGDEREKTASAKKLTSTTPVSDTKTIHPTITTSPDFITAMPANLEKEVIPVLPGHTPSPVVISPLTEQGTQLGGTPYGVRRLKVTKRSLREGKSQSLILLTALEPEDKDNTLSKKHASESTSGFEHKIQVMLQRMGMAKTPPSDTKNKDEELIKANSEDAILDKPEPPRIYRKPRAMSTSSDPKHHIGSLDPINLDPFLYPTISEHPINNLPPKPAIAAKPPIPTPGSPAQGGVCSASVTSSSSTAEPVLLRAIMNDGKPEETTIQNGSQEDAQGAAFTLSPRKELLHSTSSSWRVPIAQHHSDKAQPVAEELKAVLQRSPIRFRANREDFQSCIEAPSIACDTGRYTDKETNDTERSKDLKAEKRNACPGDAGAENKHPVPGKEMDRGPECSTSTAETQQEAAACHFSSPAATKSTLEKSLGILTSQKKCSNIGAPLPKTVEKHLVSPPPLETLKHNPSCI